MNGKDDIQLFVNVSKETHYLCVVVAAKIGIGRGELYRQAITWAIKETDFLKALNILYSGNIKSEGS